MHLVVYVEVEIRGVLEMAQKVIGGGQSHMTPYMHNFEMAQNSNHLVLLDFLFEILIACLNSELAQFF